MSDARHEVIRAWALRRFHSLLQAGLSRRFRCPSFVYLLPKSHRVAVPLATARLSTLE